MGAPEKRLAGGRVEMAIGLGGSAKSNVVIQQLLLDPQQGSL